MATAKQASKVDVKEIVHATLGLQATVYDFGKAKIDALADQAKTNLDEYIARGAKVEADVISRIDGFKADFKTKDNLVTKGWAKSEEQVKKAQAQVEELVGKVKELMPFDTAAIKAKPKAKKTTARKKAPAKKKAAAKKAA